MANTCMEATQNNYSPTRQFLKYYGGKTRIREKIIELFPSEFTTYCEPFVGGGAVLAGFGGAKWNVINDMNGNIANFYKVLKERTEEFINAESVILHDEYTFKKYKQIWKSGRGSELERALATYHMQFCFNGDFSSGMSIDGNTCMLINNTRGYLLEKSKILQNTTILNENALTTIGRKAVNTAETLFYIDPPYPGANQGHYKGYTTDDFIQLLEKLKSIKGKFILSCYYIDDDRVQELLNGYYKVEIDTLCYSKKTSNGELRGDDFKRTELLYLNYEQEDRLFP